MFNLSAVLNLTGVNTSSVDSTMNQLNSRMRGTTKTAENLADAIALKGMSLVPYTVASVAILKMSEAIGRATRDAIKFESEVAKIAQTLNISNRQAAKQTKFIGDLSYQFGLSAPKIAEVTRVLAQAGGEFENIVTLEKTVAALTQSTLLASFEDLTETTDGVIAAMSQFSKEGVTAAKVIALVNTVSKRYAVEAGDLFEAVRKAGGSFAATGGQLKELIGLFTTIRDTTRESAESIAVGLRTITARLQRPATVNFFDKIGISLRDAKGEFVGTLQAIQIIQKALVDKKINPKSLIFSQIVEQLGGVLQQSRVIPLLLEGAKLTRILAEEEAAEAEVAADAAKQQETLAFKIAQTQQNIAALFREISESKGFKILRDSALGLTNALVELVRVTKDAIPLLALLGGASLAGSVLRRASGVGLSKGAKLAAYGTGAAAYAFAGGFNTGGKIPGSGFGDKMEILAEPGEFMIKRTRAQEIGYGKLHALNSGQVDLPGYMSGGVIGSDPEKDKQIADLRARIAKAEGIATNKAFGAATRKEAEKKAASLAAEVTRLRGSQDRVRDTSGMAAPAVTKYDSPEDIKRREAKRARAEAAILAEQTAQIATTKPIPQATEPQKLIGYTPPPVVASHFPDRSTIDAAQEAHRGKFKDSPRARIAINAAASSQMLKRAAGENVPNPGEMIPTNAELAKQAKQARTQERTNQTTRDLLVPTSINPPVPQGPTTQSSFIPSYGYGSIPKTTPVPPQVPANPYPGVGGPNTTAASPAQVIPSYGYGKPPVTPTPTAPTVPFPGLGGPNTSPPSGFGSVFPTGADTILSGDDFAPKPFVPSSGYDRSKVPAVPSAPAVPFPGLGGPNTSPGNIATNVPAYGYNKPPVQQAPAVPFPGVGGPSTAAPYSRFTAFDSPEDIARRQAKEARFASSQNPYGQTPAAKPMGPYPGLGGPSTGPSSASPSAIFDPYKDKPVTTLDSTTAPTRYSSPVGPDRGTLEAQRAKERNDLFNSLGQRPAPPTSVIDTIKRQQEEARAQSDYQDRIDRANEYKNRQYGPRDSISAGERQGQKDFYADQRAAKKINPNDGNKSFSYSGINEYGEEKSGSIRAKNEKEAQSVLRARSLYIDKIREDDQKQVKKQGFFSRLFGKRDDFQTNPNSPAVSVKPKGMAPSDGGYIPKDPYGQNRPSPAATTTSTTTTTAAPTTGGLKSGLKGLVGGVGGVGAGAIIGYSISSLREWTAALTTSKDGIQSTFGKVVDFGLGLGEVVGPMVAYTAAQQIAEKGISGFAQSIAKIVPRLAPRALLAGGRTLATAGLSAAKGGAVAAAPAAAFVAKGAIGGLALFEGIAAISRFIKGKSASEEGGRDESFVLAVKRTMEARRESQASTERVNKTATDRGVSFEDKDTGLISAMLKGRFGGSLESSSTRLIDAKTQERLSKFVTKGENGKVSLTDRGVELSSMTEGSDYFDAFIKELNISGRDATEFSLALGQVREELEVEVLMARQAVASKKEIISAEKEAIRSLIGFSSAAKRASDLSSFGDSASNIASGSFRVNASELGASGTDPRRIASVGRQIGATPEAIRSVQSEGEKRGILETAKIALQNSNDPAAFDAFAEKLIEIVNSDPTIVKEGIAAQDMGPEQLLAAAEGVVEAQSSLKKEMIEAAKNFDKAFNQYIDSISRANEAQLSLNQALLDFGDTTRSRRKERESFSATGTTLTDIRQRRASIGPVGDGSALRAGLVATSARLAATGMAINRDPQNAALQQTFAGLQVQQKAQMELLKQDNQLRSQLIDSIKEELALEQGRAKTFQEVNKALSGEMGIDAQIQAQETARIANEAQSAVDRGDVAGAQRIISDSSMFGQNADTIKGLLRTSSREAIDQYSQRAGAAAFGGGPLQRDAQFSAFGRTEQGTALDNNLGQRNRELSQNDAANIQAMSDNVLLLKDTASLFTQSISAMGGHMTAFSGEMRNIVASLNNASVKLTMAPTNVVVSLNNAEGLGAMSKEMKRLINEAVAQKFLEKEQGI